MEVEVDQEELKSAGAEFLFIHGREIESRNRLILNLLALQQWEQRLQTSPLYRKLYSVKVVWFS